MNSFDKALYSIMKSHDDNNVVDYGPNLGDREVCGKTRDTDQMGGPSGGD